MILPSILALLLLVMFRRVACEAAQAMLGASFAAATVAEERFHSALVSVTGWLRRSGTPEPRATLVGMFLLALAVAVAYADYSVLLASLTLVWPTDVPPAWLAFSVVAITAAVGMLAHSVRGMLPRAALLLLTCALIGAQATVAYLRTTQLAAVRSTVDATTETSDDGSLVIVGATSATPSRVTPVAVSPPSPLPDRLGPAMAAGIAAVLCISQVAAAWGGISFGGGALTWILALPSLLALAVPWLALRMLSASGLRDGSKSVLDATIASLDAAWRTLAGMAPFPSTEASLLRRLERKRRTRMAELQDKEDAGAASLRASVEQELRDAEKDAFREFLGEYARLRRGYFRDALQEAFQKERADFQGVARCVVWMWFWPLDKAWHLMSVLTSAGRFGGARRAGTDSETGHREVER